ncbi:MAG: hypothetical protein EHM48_06090, partial [Planctomycetaceae bacterium]
MTALVFSFVFTFLLLAAALHRLFEPTRKRIFGIPPAVTGAILCAALALVPIGGLPSCRWLASLYANFSMPLAVLLFCVVWRSATGRTLLRDKDIVAFWAFGLLAGLVLYPMALGVGPVDPYAWGWGSGWLFIVLGAISAAMFFCGNRLGFALLLAVVGWHLCFIESTNIWDYVVDPAYFIASAAAIIARLLRKVCQC